MNKLSITFLEKQLARAISKSLTRKIPNLLELLGRELTSEEKKSLIKSAVIHSDADCLVAALTITGLGTESLTDAMIIQYNKKPFSQSRILNWKLGSGKIEKLITSSLLNGDITYASEYAESIGRKLSSTELLLCTKALASKGFPHVDYIPEILKLWGKNQLPAPYRKIIIGKYKKFYHYEGFKTAGGTRRDVSISWFKKLIDKLIRKHDYADALDIVCKEKLFQLSNVLKLFKQIGKNMVHLRIQDGIKKFTEQAPATVVSKCLAILILNSQSLPSVFVEKLGFKLNDKAFVAFIKNLKNDEEASDRVGLNIKELEHFHRKPNHAEVQVILNYLARSGNYKLFFETANKYSFKVIPSMIHTLEKNVD